MQRICLLTAIATASGVSCKSESGDDVGNWELFKFPKSTSYVYSQNSYESSYSLNDTTNGALAHTMQQLWLPNVNYTLYNDEPPYSTSYNFSVAHAKAALIWDESSAIGIFHSIPKFPVGPGSSSSYIGLLPNAWDYAQHVACINLPIETFPTIASSLSTLTPEIYEGSMLNIEDIKSSETCEYLTLDPAVNRILITKPQSYNVDIWETCISPYFGTDLQVMSWIHGTMDGPYTNQTTTTDISGVTYSFGVSYSEYDNHAKWAIGQTPLVCIGDLNRVESQKQRSGAAICWKDLDVWNALNSIILPSTHGTHGTHGKN